MSGCYEYNECGYEQSWDYDYCYKPRHRKPRHKRHHYSECWDYSPTYCS